MDGKVAIVTGGAGGIGSAVSRAFADAGVAVAVADVDVTRADKTAAEVVERGGRAIGIEVQVSSEPSVEAMLCRGLSITSAGWTSLSTVPVTTSGRRCWSSRPSDWSSVLDTHLTGAFLFSKAVGRRLVEQGEGGRVVFMSSVAAKAPVPERGAYSPAKAGLIGLAGVLSLEWAQYGINVNAVCPGMVQTPMTELVYKREPALKAQRLKRMPAGREAYPEEIADLVLFLCSERSAHISGTAIPIDGAFLNNGFMLEPE